LRTQTLGNRNINVNYVDKPDVDKADVDITDENIEINNIVKTRSGVRNYTDFNRAMDFDINVYKESNKSCCNDFKRDCLII
jgi:hypothetical protein